MKLLRRNLTEFEYLPYGGVDSDLNEAGEHTGEFHHEYGEPIPYKGNISIPSGSINHTFYGDDIRYTHTLLMDDVNAELDEYGAILWKGDMYDIVAVRRSMNVISAALKKRTKQHDDPYVQEEQDEPEEHDDTDGDG